MPKTAPLNGVALSDEVREHAEELIAWRRELHQYPELGFKEERTAKFIEAKLKSFGVKFKRMCGTGVAALVEGEQPGKTILIRADMDGLPVTELNDVDYKSKNAGAMHACGHDGHVAIGLMAAKLLQARRKNLKGNVKFMFQPAEEGPGGALPMIKAGLLENPKVDYAFALHMWNDLRAGTVGVRPGPVFASASTFTLKIHGKGGHGAAPHETIDPIVIAANFITQLQTIVSRRMNPVKPSVVTIGKIQGGVRCNVIPDSVAMEGTLRSFDKKIHDKIKSEIKRTLKGVTAAHGARYELEFEIDYPPTINHPEATKLVREAASAVVGAGNVIEQDPTMGAEDMSFVLDRVPGCYFCLGSSNKDKGLTSPHHSATFNFDEDALSIGVEVWLRLAQNVLR